MKHSDQLGKCGWTFAQPDAQGVVPLCVWLQDAMLSVELAVPVQQTYHVNKAACLALGQLDLRMTF